MLIARRARSKILPVKFSDVKAALSSVCHELRAAQERLSNLLSADDPGPREAADLLEARVSLRHSEDPEIEPLGDFSGRLRAMADLIEEATTTLQSKYGGRSCRDADEARNQLIDCLIPIAEAAGITVNAYYSGVEGKAQRCVCRSLGRSDPHCNWKARLWFRTGRAGGACPQVSQVKIQMKSGQF